MGVTILREIKVGEVIQIPYLVKPGDTSWSISVKFGISEQHLLWLQGYDVPDSGSRYTNIDPATGIPYGYIEPQDQVSVEDKIEDAVPDWYFRDLLGDEG